jgi:Serine hydroxymethyltransferase
MYDLEEKINFSVFPGHQGGPHNHTITALAVALGQALKPEFKEYAQQVVKNAKVLEEEFKKRGYDLASGGTGTQISPDSLLTSQTHTWFSLPRSLKVQMELERSAFWRLSTLHVIRILSPAVNSYLIINLISRYKCDQPWGYPCRCSRHDHSWFQRARVCQDRGFH